MSLPEGRYAINKSDCLGDISIPSVPEISLRLMKQLHLSFETAVKAMIVTTVINTIHFSSIIR